MNFVIPGISSSMLPIQTLNIESLTRVQRHDQFLVKKLNDIVPSYQQEKRRHFRDPKPTVALKGALKHLTDLAAVSERLEGRSHLVDGMKRLEIFQLLLRAIPRYYFNGSGSHLDRLLRAACEYIIYLPAMDRDVDRQDEIRRNTQEAIKQKPNSVEKVETSSMKRKKPSIASERPQKYRKCGSGTTDPPLVITIDDDSHDNEPSSEEEEDEDDNGDNGDNDNLIAETDARPEDIAHRYERQAVEIAALRSLLRLNGVQAVRVDDYVERAFERQFNLDQARIA